MMTAYQGATRNSLFTRIRQAARNSEHVALIGALVLGIGSMIYLAVR